MAFEGRPALCVCGLAAEAAVARRAGLAAIVGGGDADLTARRLEAALPGAGCLISFGIAGGLDPSLGSGTVVLSGEVIGEAARWRGSDAWMRRIDGLAHEIGAAAGPVFGAERIVAGAEDKRRLRTETGAAAVDLESAIVARAGAENGIPFVVLRAIADAAARDLPAAAMIPLNAEGRPRIGRILASAMARPGQLPALTALARDSRRALAALAAPALALSDLLSA